MADEAIRIDVTIEDLKAEKSLKDLERKSKKTFKSFEKDTKRGTKAAGRFSKALTGIKGKLLALGSAAAIIGIGRQAVQNFLAQEKAVIRLDAALKLQGNTLGFVRTEMDEYASALQKITVFGDDAIISGMALATSFGATTDQAKELVLQAANLSAALDQDLNASIQQMARTLGGMMGELGEKLPALRGLTREQLMGGGVIGVVRQQFGGTAAQLAASEGGRITQALNKIGDDLEGPGFLIAHGLSIIAEWIGKATEFLPGFGNSKPASLLTPSAQATLKERVANEQRRLALVREREKLGGDMAAFMRAAGLGVDGPIHGLQRLRGLKEATTGISPDTIAALIDIGRSPAARRSERDEEINRQFGLLGELRGIQTGDAMTVTAGDSQARERFLFESQRQAFTEENPAIATFGDDLSMSVESSFATGIQTAIRSGSVKDALQAFGDSLLDSVTVAFSEGIARSLVSGVGIDDITGLLSGLGGASAKPAGGVAPVSAFPT